MAQAQGEGGPSADMGAFLDQRLGGVSAGPMGFGSSSVSGQVYLGVKNIPRQTKVTRGGTVDNLASLDDANAQIYSWNDKQVKSWADLLVKNGVLKPGDYNFADLVQMWQGAVEESGKFYAAGKKITPQKYVEMYAGAYGRGGQQGGGAVSQARTVSRTDSSVQDFSDLDARAMANEVGQNLLGENPDPKFSAALEAALDAYATNNPQITNSTSRYNSRGDLVSSSSKSRGGVNGGEARQIAEDRARANPDYAEYQSATTYYNALLQGIQSPVDI